MSKRFIILPIDETKPHRHIRLTNEKGELLYDINCSIELNTPAFESYMDVTRFGDDKITVTDDEGNVLPLKETDRHPEISEIRGGSFMRPKIHFTSKIGWMNDPNGMVYMNGTYHLFYQHNPYSLGYDQDSMTWDHAVSTDLVHWEETGDIIFTDELGGCFSGSAVCDERNVAGFGKNAMVCFYTSAGNGSDLSRGKYFTQSIAYSNDNALTMKKYDKNPIINWIRGANRDPKVEWCEELGKYVMALYLDGPDFRIFTSDDLIDWEPLQDVTMPNDNECPAFYPLVLDGERKWVFQGAHDKYLIGSIKDGKYVIEQEELPYYIWSEGSYSPQSFYGTGDRRIRIALNRAYCPGAVFSGQMGVPTEFFLKRAGDKIRLGSLPVKELDSIAKKKIENINIQGSEAFECLDINALRNSGIEVTLNIKEGCGAFTLSCFGKEIRIDPEANEFATSSVKAPLSYDGEKNIKVIFDTLSIEAFADGGLIYSVSVSVADRTKNVKIIPESTVDLTAEIKVLEL